MLRVDVNRSPAQTSASSYFRWCQYEMAIYQNAGRSRIARERLLLASQPIVEPPERFLERPILQERLGDPD